MIYMGEVLEEKVTGTRRIHEGRIINLRVDDVTLPNGRSSKREIVEHRGAIAVVPMLDRDTVVMVRQYRAAACAALLEIPAGTRDPDEDLTITAHRELAEEINFKAGRMIKLFQAFVAPGYSTEVIHTFLALDLQPTSGHTDEDEFIEIVTLPLAEAIQKVENGEIVDSKSISGLLYVQKMLPTLAV
jgi:ADP-ribose pyrophosphatase